MFTECLENVHCTLYMYSQSGLILLDIEKAFVWGPSLKTLANGAKRKSVHRSDVIRGDLDSAHPQ